MPEQKRTSDERIAGLRVTLRIALAEATSLIETAPDTSSESWFEFSERLGDACWNLAAATHRPNERPERDKFPRHAAYRQTSRTALHTRQEPTLMRLRTAPIAGRILDLLLERTQLCEISELIDAVGNPAGSRRSDRHTPRLRPNRARGRARTDCAQVHTLTHHGPQP